MVKNFLFLLGKVDAFGEQKLLAVLRDIVLERFHRLFKENARVGGVLVDNQKAVGVFTCDVGVCNLEERRRSPRGLGLRLRLGEVGFQRNNLAVFGERKQVLDVIAHVVFGLLVRKLAGFTCMLRVLRFCGLREAGLRKAGLREIGRCAIGRFPR